MILESEAFRGGDPIPQRYTCDGADVSPPLAWREAPAGTVTFALVMDDPDAPVGRWVHWVVSDLPESTRELREGISARTLPSGAVEGSNSWGRRGYGGPCPPSRTHRYLFKLYALDASLGVASGITAAELEGAMHGRVLAQASLMGRYERS